MTFLYSSSFYTYTAVHCVLILWIVIILGIPTYFLSVSDQGGGQAVCSMMMVDGVTGMIAPSWALLVSIRDHSTPAQTGNSSSSQPEISLRPHMTLIGSMTGISQSPAPFING